MENSASLLSQLAVALFVIITSTIMLIVATVSGHFAADLTFLIATIAFFWIVLNRLEKEERELAYQPIYVEKKRLRGD